MIRLGGARLAKFYSITDVVGLDSLDHDPLLAEAGNGEPGHGRSR